MLLFTVVSRLHNVCTEIAQRRSCTKVIFHYERMVHNPNVPLCSYYQPLQSQLSIRSRMPPHRRQSQCKRYAGTQHKCDDEGNLLTMPFGGLKYAIGQKEVGPKDGKVHLQFYVEFTDKLRLSQIKRLGPFWESCHLEPAKGTPEQNIAYCSKPDTAIPGSQFRHGIPQRNGVTASYDEGLEALQEGASLETIRTLFPKLYLRSLNQIKSYIQSRDACIIRSSWVLPVNPYPWQSDVLSILDIPTVPVLAAPHDRRVNWIYDLRGGKGKSTLVQMILRKYGDNAVLCISSSYKRVVESMQQNQHVVLMDLPRAYPMDKFQYDSLELIKNGAGARVMYIPETKVWRNPHLVVFSNSLPDRSKLTLDRWHVLDLSTNNP